MAKEIGNIELKFDVTGLEDMCHCVFILINIITISQFSSKTSKSFFSSGCFSIFIPSAFASCCVSSITCLPPEAQYLVASISFPIVHFRKML